MSSKPPKPKFVLHLEAQHRHDDQNGMRRLRAVLKLLLRTFGFRCKRIDYPEDETLGPSDAPMTGIATSPQFNSNPHRVTVR